MNEELFIKAVKAVEIGKCSTYGPKEIFERDEIIEYVYIGDIPFFQLASKQNQLNILYYLAYWFPLVKGQLKKEGVI